MVIQGHSENGVIVLDEDVRLRDGTPVTVEVDLDISEYDFHPDIKRLSGILSHGSNAEALYYESDRA